MSSGSRTVYSEVSTVLWRERDLLDGLAYSLEMQRLVLQPGRTRWLARACREVEASLDLLSTAELTRAVCVDTLACELGLPPAPTLRAIVAAVGDPWKEIFMGHQRAFQELIGEVLRLAKANRAQLQRSRMSSSAAPGWLRLDQWEPLGGSHPLLGEDR